MSTMCYYLKNWVVEKYIQESSTMPAIPHNKHFCFIFIMSSWKRKMKNDKKREDKKQYINNELKKLLQAWKYKISDIHVILKIS